MASPPFMLGRRVRSNKDTFVDPSEREPEAPAPPVAVGVPFVFSNPAPDAVVEEAEAPPSTSDGRVRCARRKDNWQCAHLFVPGLTPQGKLQTRCERCRASNRRFMKSDAYKAARKRYNTSDKGEATRKQHQKIWHENGGKEVKKRYNSSDRGKAVDKRYKRSNKGKASEKRFYKSEKGKALKKRKNSKLSAQILMRLCKICRDGGIESTTVLTATGCASTAELRAHFESTFEPWMTWSNRGSHKAGGNSEAWQIGHRLACAFYDDSNPADIKRCWNTANLFAQDADENHMLSVTMPDDAVLERLRALDLLPSAWGGIVPPAAQRVEMERLARLPVDYR